MDNLKYLYAETDSLELKESRLTGWLRVIIGDAFNVDSREGQYKGKRKQIFFSKFVILGRDHQIHDEIKRVYNVSHIRYVKEDVQSREVFEFKVNPEASDEEKMLQVSTVLGEIVKSVGGSIDTFTFIPTSWQRKAIEFVAESWAAGKSTLMLELAARFGKTGTFLTLLKYSDADIMVVANYFKSVNTSFAGTILNCFSDCIRWVNIADDNFESLLKSSLEEGYKVVVGAALHEKARLKDRIDLIKTYEKRFVLVDEADFGAHTDSQVKKVKSLREGCPLILTTGTGADKAVSDHKVDASLEVTYFDMLVMSESN